MFNCCIADTAYRRVRACRGAHEADVVRRERHWTALASSRNGTLYHGSTSDLSNRVWEHKEKLTPGFTTRYGVTKLVYYEHYDRLMDARAREYTVKRWRRMQI